jgi:hypothetical protein
LTLKMEVVCTSETSSTSLISIQCNNPRVESTSIINHLETLKSLTFKKTIKQEPKPVSETLCFFRIPQDGRSPKTQKSRKKCFFTFRHCKDVCLKHMN